MFGECGENEPIKKYSMNKKEFCAKHLFAPNGLCRFISSIFKIITIKPNI